MAASSALAATVGTGPSSTVAFAFTVNTRATTAHNSLTQEGIRTPASSIPNTGRRHAAGCSHTRMTMAPVALGGVGAASAVTTVAQGSSWIGGFSGTARATTRNGARRDRGRRGRRAAERLSMNRNFLVDNYERDFKGLPLWPRQKFEKESGVYNRCDDYVELGSSGLMVSKVRVRKTRNECVGYTEVYVNNSPSVFAAPSIGVLCKYSASQLFFSYHVKGSHVHPSELCHRMQSRGCQRVMTLGNDIYTMTQKIHGNCSEMYSCFAAVNRENMHRVEFFFVHPFVQPWEGSSDEVIGVCVPLRTKLHPPWLRRGPCLPPLDLPHGESVILFPLDFASSAPRSSKFGWPLRISQLFGQCLLQKNCHLPHLFLLLLFLSRYIVVFEPLHRRQSLRGLHSYCNFVHELLRSFFSNNVFYTCMCQGVLFYKSMDDFYRTVVVPPPYRRCLVPKAVESIARDVIQGVVCSVRVFCCAESFTYGTANC